MLLWMEKDIPSMKKHNPLIGQLCRFVVTGGLAFLVDFVVLWFFTETIQIHYLIANTLAFVSSVVLNYILSVKWVFSPSAQNTKQTELVVFMVLSTIGLGINQVVLWLCVDWVQISPMLGKIVATAIVMVYNFISRKIWLER